MKLQQLVHHLDTLAPPHLAEPWDNVGLLAGDPAADVQRVLVTIDYTAAVADEARALDCQLVVAYHPPIFKDLKRIVAPNLIHDAIRRGVALYSPHTAWDVADGGSNDVLADALGMTAERRPLRTRAAAGAFVKLVVFVPADHADAVRQALFAAGAGRLGHYDQCSFNTPGTGTFRGDAQSNPAIGQPGKLEEVNEVRVETIVPSNKLDAVVSALRHAHPYEEPAFDLLQMHDIAPPVGIGRIGPIAATSRTDLVARLKRELQLNHLLVAGTMDGVASRGACCAGSCGELLDDAIAQKAEVFLTGELRHHDALRAAAAGVTVVCTLHSHSERPSLSRLIQRLSALAPSLTLTPARRDHDPFAIR